MRNTMVFIYGIIKQESNSPIYRALLSPVRDFQNPLKRELYIIKTTLEECPKMMPAVHIV